MTVARTVCQPVPLRLKKLKNIYLTPLQKCCEHEKMHLVYERLTSESLAMMTVLRQPQFDTSFVSRLARVDLTAVMAHVAADTGLQGADLARAEQLYRQFLTLKARYPQLSLVPPKLVDTVWHTHITFTRQYFADCDLLFGEYLHHTPDLVGAEASFEAVTVPAYQAEFGVNLKAYGTGFAEGADCGS